MESAEKRGRKAKSFKWTDESRRALLQICTKYKTNNRQSAYKWREIVAEFGKQIGKEVTKDILQNKIALLKDDYILWKKLQESSATSLEYDTTSGLVYIKAHPQWWVNKIKENKRLRKFQWALIPHDIIQLSGQLFDIKAENVDIENEHLWFQSKKQKSEKYIESDSMNSDVKTIDITSNRPVSVDYSERDVMPVVYRMVDAGLVDRKSEFFGFIVGALMGDRARKTFMILETDEDRKVWLEVEYKLRCFLPSS